MAYVKLPSAYHLKGGEKGRNISSMTEEWEHSVHSVTSPPPHPVIEHSEYPILSVGNREVQQAVVVTVI